MSKLINVKDASADKNLYDIMITRGFQELSELLKPFLSEGQKVAIITDSNVGPLYEAQITNIIKELGNESHTFSFLAGEESKTLDTVQDIYEFLIERHFERRDILIALGGGVVGDMTGFTAATYLRGIKFIQIPTSLLAQTDSSIGGKTGVDFRKYKNMVGAFHQPSLCYMNMDVLSTLDHRQFLSGLAEIIKAAYIKNADFLKWLIANKEAILNLDKDVCEEMIYQACLIKRGVVERDIKEAGERAHLNFGHTLGHAIERAANFALFHGECVVLGMVTALYISYKRALISKSSYEEALDLFKGLRYTMQISGLSKEEVLDTAKSDKKMEAGVVKFILLNGIGKAEIYKDVSREEMLEALDLVLV